MAVSKYSRLPYILYIISLASSIHLPTTIHPLYHLSGIIYIIYRLSYILYINSLYSRLDLGEG